MLNVKIMLLSKQKRGRMGVVQRGEGRKQIFIYYHE